MHSTISFLLLASCARLPILCRSPPYLHTESRPDPLCKAGTWRPTTPKNTILAESWQLVGRSKSFW